MSFHTSLNRVSVTRLSLCKGVGSERMGGWKYMGKNENKETLSL